MTDTQPLLKRVLLIDRNPALSEVLALKLGEADFLTCAFGNSFDELPQAVAVKKPDVLFLDPDHLDLSGDYDLVDFAREMRAISEQTRLLGYSFKVNGGMLRAALDAGFRGLVSKNAPFRQVENALSVVLEGGIFFDQNFGSHLGEMFADDIPDEDGLSEREKSVIVGVARGLSSKQIAKDLNISAKTVDTYKSRAGKKLNLADRAELVGYVHDRGWII